jgi:ubiquinol oxidase
MGKIKNIPAPEIAINYWNLPLNATLKDVVKVIRDDEAGHRDVNHSFADIINSKIKPKLQTSNKVQIKDAQTLNEKN